MLKSSLNTYFILLASIKRTAQVLKKEHFLKTQMHFLQTSSSSQKKKCLISIRLNHNWMVLQSRNGASLFLISNFEEPRGAKNTVGSWKLVFFFRQTIAEMMDRGQLFRFFRISEDVNENLLK